ncbi:MAG: hypothetical protein AVDCRST_MAG05-2105, partial [uncultured Rubrobacteraceae bacterium]
WLLTTLLMGGSQRSRGCWCRTTGVPAATRSTGRGPSSSTAWSSSWRCSTASIASSAGTSTP